MEIWNLPCRYSCRRKKIMAKINEIVSQATPTYQPDNLNQFGRDINNIIQKLNTTYPSIIVDDTEAESFFFSG